MSSRPKIESVYDFTEKGLVELKAWLEPWFPSGGGEGGGEIVWEDTGTGAGGGAGASGIQFDTDPQEGTFLVVTTTGHIDGAGTGDDGIEIYANDGNIGLSATGAEADGGHILIAGDSGVGLQGWGDLGILIEAKGAGDLVLRITGGVAQIQLVGLPTSSPGGPNTLWRDSSGFLRIG